MRGIDEGRGLEKLLRLAKAKVDEERGRVETLEAARRSAAASIEALDEMVKAERSAANPDARGAVTDFAGFLEGVERKRQALVATRNRLAGEISTADNELETAYTEMKKLEHLIERSAADRKKLGAKIEREELDESGRYRTASRR